MFCPVERRTAQWHARYRELHWELSDKHAELNCIRFSPCTDERTARELAIKARDLELECAELQLAIDTMRLR